MPEPEPVRCNVPECQATHPNHKWGNIKAHSQGWYQEKSGVSWCPVHRPVWARKPVNA